MLTSLLAISAHAAITGVISGTVTDPNGAVVPKVAVVATEQSTGIKHTVVSDSRGFFSFPSLDVGTYIVSASTPGFESFQLKGMKVDANSSMRADIALRVGSVTQVTEVTSNAVQVETQSTQLGEVIESSKITAVPLNGRAYTDLLALQPGVSPYQGTSESASEGGKTVSGSLNAGNMSINGGREASNGFMVNGSDVNDGVENGTAIVPNLDSISEFRIITNNFDAEYGNFSGGQVNVVTKNGTNQIHGSAFEFFRNTVLNASNYFAVPLNTRGPYNQNIYGGTVGGPIKRDKIFFFADFQGTNQSIGTSESVQTVSATDKTGDVSDLSSFLVGTVNGPGWANVLSNRLGYAVTENEAYYTPGCTTATCVFPNAIIPTKAWDPTVSGMLKYFPAPNTTVNDLPYYSTSANALTLKDYKEAGRVDVNTRFGIFFGYYFMDNYTQIDPYGGGTDGQFPASTTGRAQLANLGLTTTFKNNSVNTFRFSYMRSTWHADQPAYTTPGPSLASQGFLGPWGPGGGISPISNALEGVPQISVNSMSFGTPGAIDGHYDNTFQWLDNYMKVIGTHTIQFGGSYHYDQINERNFDGPNGVFGYSDANETGAGFADFLLGADSGNFTQSSPQILDNRGIYVSAFVEDAWRARTNLTLNYGVRYEIITPWWDKTNKMETIIPGEQSKVFLGAPVGWVFPGDAGVPRTLAPIKYDKFAPRFGFAYAPTVSSSFLSKVLGGTGVSSIRGGFGIFYTNFQEESGYEEAGDAPYGNYYQAPVPTMMFSPYVDRGSQTIETQKFPFAWPASNVSPSNPDSTYNWAGAVPLSESFAVRTTNTVPYNMNYFIGVQRALGKNTVLTVNYVGSQGRHLANAEEANPGDPALCLSLSSQSEVAPGTSTCAPKLETQVYTRADGTMVQGTRPTLGISFGSNPYTETRATSNFNSLQANIKHTSKLWDVLLGYTYGRSMDNASGLTDPINPYNPKATYGLSKFDVRHYVVASYNLHLPFGDWVSNRFAKSLVGGWSITGITRMATGVPVTMSDNEDYSLTGAGGVDFPYYSPGNLFAGGALGDKNPRDFSSANPGKHNPWFNTSLFTAEGKKFTPKTLGYGLTGNSRRRFFYGPGIDSTDVAVLREFHIHEAHTIQLRAEAFNVLNHTQFGPPSGSVTSSTFGIITSAINPRVLQVAVKYRF
ncbi:MAG: carboxypeptidase-like regulatory domain-containing protein [Edaphobacter sp.]